MAKQDRPQVNWQVLVIDDPKTVNAFATPGGYLYVYSGLLAAADTEDEVAGVLAHEAGHVVGRHSARQMVDAYGLQAVAALALGRNPSLLEQLAAGIGAQGLMLAHSRSDEKEADIYAVRYSSRAGYDPNGIVTFFEKLKQKEGKVPGALVWLQTHPATSDRITNVREYMAKNNIAGRPSVPSPRHGEVKQRILARTAGSNVGAK